MRARMRDSRGVDQDILVRNISEHGLGAASKGDPVARGESVSINLPQLGMVSGRVCWAKGTAFGVLLDGPLDLEALDSAMRSIADAPTRQGWEVKRMHRVVTPGTDPTKLRRI